MDSLLLEQATFTPAILLPPARLALGIVHFTEGPFGHLIEGAGGLPKRMLGPGRGREADTFPETILMPSTTFNRHPCHTGLRADFECGQR